MKSPALYRVANDSSDLVVPVGDTPLLDLDSTLLLKKVEMATPPWHRDQ